MLKNYIKIAWRNIINRKFYTFLNITGLALAISCCIFIYLYSSYNLSFDRYHKNFGRMFRLVNQLHFDKTEYDPSASYAEYQYLKKQVPQVQQATFMIRNQSYNVVIGNDTNKRFKEEGNISFTDADWFKIFSYQWIAGKATQLNGPGYVVLTQKMAHKYFGNADAMGKVIMLNGHPVTVTGVIEDAPYNTDFRSEMYVSFRSLLELDDMYGKDKTFLKSWGNMGTKYTGVVTLKNASDQAAVERQLAAMKKTIFGADYKVFDFFLLPIKDVHFDTRYLPTIQKTLLWNLAIIGILIIAIAIINYINIVVAQQTRRGVEIGTRKVLGGSAGQIFMQFIVESLVTSAISVIIAAVLVIILLPVANSWLFTDNPIYILSYGNLALYLLALLIIISIGTGVYPAWLLSRVSIARALKNNVFNFPAGIGRKILVVFQNVVTQSLIVCTIVMISQVYFMRNTDIGFDRKMVVTIPTGQTTTSQRYQLEQSLKQIPGVLGQTFCLASPSSTSQRGGTVLYSNKEWEKWVGRFAFGDSAYCQTFGLKLIKGRNMRNFQPVPEFLVNETLAKKIATEYGEDVVNKKFIAGDISGIIVGVVHDFNFNSLVGRIEPTILLQVNSLQTNMAVKLTGSDTKATISEIQRVYQKLLPDQVFSYKFVDEQIALLYQKENVQQKLIWIGAVVAITISSLGLLGLVSLMALQRTKEIGIRKVLGASVSQICLMLSNDFIWMVLMAFIIASSMSVWAMNKWLQHFAYRIHIAWWMLALSGILAVIIAVLSIGFQAIKAAIANPVNSLRSE